QAERRDGQQGRKGWRGRKGRTGGKEGRKSRTGPKDLKALSAQTAPLLPLLPVPPPPALPAPPGLPARPARVPVRRLKVVLDRDLRRPRGHDGRLRPGRGQPGAARSERLIRDQNRVEVQRIEEIERNVRPRPAEAENLAHAEIELVHPIAAH